MTLVDAFLTDLTGRYARPYADAIHDMYVSEVVGDRIGRIEAVRTLSEVMHASMGVAETVGARMMLMEVGLQNNFQDGQTILPRITFDEAIEDLATRVPKTVRSAAQRTAEVISQIYQTGRVGDRGRADDRIIAFAKSAEARVTREARDFMARAIRQGLSEAEAGRQLKARVDEVRKRTRPWSESYARMVFRTNANTAVTAGRFRQARDPDLGDFVAAFRYDAVGDADTRSNHAAANNMILRIDNPAWRYLSPPLGYNCRCQVVPVSRYSLEQMGRLASDGSVRESRVNNAAQPDPGFRHGGRPDLLL
jgi:SPP1 gp7 family putative phage head morphogenesis protein